MTITVISFNDAAEQSEFMFQAAPQDIYKTMGFVDFMRHYMAAFANNGHENAFACMESYLGLTRDVLTQWTGYVAAEPEQQALIFEQKVHLPLPIIQLAVIAACQCPTATSVTLDLRH